MTRKSVSLLHVAAAVLFLSASSESALAQTVSFIGHADFAAGSNPASVAAGDFNRDGVLDLATANYGSNNVSVLLGNGDGTFQAAQTYATAGFNPEFVAVGDVNLDGRQDLAVAQSGSTPSLVSVLLGNGDGSFQPARIFATGQGSLSVAIGDVNGDGRPALAVADFRPTDVSVLLGNGDGTFQAPRNFATGTVPLSMAVGDVNSDGQADLAVANFDFNIRGPNTVSVLLGNGDGTFQAAQAFSVGTNPASVAMGDFNGDVRQDLAVGNFNSDNVSVLINNTALAPNSLTVNRAGTGSGTVRLLGA